MIQLTSPEGMSRFLTILIGGPMIFFVSLIIIITIYKTRQYSINMKFGAALDQVLICWKQDAVDTAVRAIEIKTPIPLERIETYSNDILLGN